MVKDAAIKAEMIMINGMEERLSNSIRSKSLAKNNSWKYFLFKSSTLRIGFFGKIKKNSSKLKVALDIGKKNIIEILETYE